MTIDRPELLPVPPEIRALAEELAPGRWPTADVVALRDSATRCRELASQVASVIADLNAAHRRGAAGSGAFHDGIVVGHGQLVDGSDSALARTAGRLTAAAAALDAYASTATAAHNEMAVITSVADRERLRAELLSGLGDDSARVVAASAGRMAMTAAGDEYTMQAADDGQRHNDDQPAPAATSGMMPFAALGGLAAGAGALAAGAHTPAAASVDAHGISTTDTDWLQLRAAQLQSALPASVAGSVRLAVGLGRGPDGGRTLVVGTDECYPYERDGVGIAGGETLVGDGRAAELAIVDHMTGHGVRPLAIAAATPVAPDTVTALGDTDAALFAPRDDAADGHWISEESGPGGDQP
ncbi:hypothetical protein V1Y59_06430 [Gordonia sp. PKS22-38]|uniref:DUF222 domain-containing protein n=1 Tax=Gordonia prachuapensis TaxID=3115651 RepID=A0ABU7MQW7_9ACTN|nr:hypothetical protein [Gordonia sp. PKS22-38]